MLGSIAGILQGAGAVAGALGGGKSQQVQQTQSGFAALPKEIQDYLLKQQLPKIQAYGETPFATVPYRRAGAAELDPVFGSKAFQDLQRLNDMRVMRQFATPQQTQATAPTASSQSSMDALNWLSSQRAGFMPQTRQAQMLGKVQNMDVLAELLAEYKQKYGESPDRIEALSNIAAPERLSKIYG